MHSIESISQNISKLLSFISAIRTLARNDANKKLLVQLGALELLVELSKGDEDEQTGRDCLVYVYGYTTLGTVFSFLSLFNCYALFLSARDLHNTFHLNYHNHLRQAMTKD